LIILMQSTVLIVSVVLMLLKWSFSSAFKVAFIFGTSLNFILILGHEISEYKPTRTITVPDDFAGCIYLLSTIEERTDVTIDENGVGYWGSNGRVIWEIERDGVDITDAFNISHADELTVYNDGGRVMTTYHVNCIEIATNDMYLETHIDYYDQTPCMDTIKFQDLVELGWIDESRLRETVYFEVVMALTGF
jgi:hypothetical protein